MPLPGKRQREPVPPRFAEIKGARLRAKAVRGGIVKLAFGTVFLIGALAHALSPARHESVSLFWISLLLVMSTANVALGLQSVSRGRRLTARAAGVAAAAWGLLSLVLLGLLLRR